MVMLILIMSGCAQNIVKKPFYVSSDFKPVDKQVIAVLPPIKLGMDENLDTEFDVHGIIDQEIVNRGYAFDDKSNVPLPGNASSMIENADFKWIEQLQFKPNSWVLIVVVETLRRQQYQLGMRADSILSGYLVDASSEKVIWQGAGFGSNTKGFLGAALVDDIALQYAERDLMRSLPLNNSANDKPAVSDFSLSDYYKFPVVKGSCPNGNCDHSDPNAHICVIIDKSNSFLNDDDGGDSSEKTVNNYPVYDTRKLIGNLEIGKYMCWIKHPSKTIIHLNMHRPAYFKAEAGKFYYLDAKFSSNSWAFSEIPASQVDQILAAHKNSKNE